MNNEELKIISCDAKSGMLFAKILEVEPKCYFCNINVTELNFGGIFSKPTRLCCDSILCISEAVSFENKYVS
jgi:hypothetical protein